MKEYLSVGETSLDSLLGICVKTLHRWENLGKLKSSFRTIGNHRRYLKYDVLKVKNKEKRINIGYSRVSSYDQNSSEDLERQSQYLIKYLSENNIFNINIKYIDEAYTSKTSCLTRDVNKNQEKRHNGLQVIPTDLNGSRGTKGSKLGRGIFKDKELNVIFNSDLNGAANHIKVGFPKVKISRFRNQLWKVCSPKKVISTNELDRFLVQ